MTDIFGDAGHASIFQPYDYCGLHDVEVGFRLSTNDSFELCAVGPNAIFGNNPCYVTRDAHIDSDILLSRRATERCVNLDVREYTSATFCASLKTNTTLESLYLGGCFITDIRVLADALRTNTTLKYLSINNNPIEDITPLWHAMRVNKSLVFLDASALSSPMDMPAIADMIADNTTLETLILRKNRIADIEALGPAIKNSTIKHLFLSENDITCIGPEFIAGLMVNTALTLLVLSDNSIAETGILERALDTNRSLTHVYICRTFNNDMKTAANGRIIFTTGGWR